jgi:hypothetical protein
MIAILALAARIGGYKNEHLAKALNIAVGCGFVVWLFVYYPGWVAWVAGFVVCMIVFWAILNWNSFRRSNPSSDPTPTEAQSQTPESPPQIPQTPHTVPPPSPVPTTHDSRLDERIIIDVTPDDLWKICDEYTTLQAQKLIGIYVGKWIRVSGPFGDVMGKEPLQVTFASRTFRNVIFMYFSLEWHDRLVVLKRGALIAVIGRIVEVNQIELHLGHCELEVLHR